MPSSSMEDVAGGDTADAEAVARVLEGIAHALERMVARNERVTRADEEEEEEEEEEGETAALGAERMRGRGLAAFRGTRAPGIGVGKYLERLWRYTGCSSSCFVVGFVYIDRAAHRHPASPVVSLNVHRLVLTSLLIASKVLDDKHHNNAFFAKVGGVSNADLNRMELELLFLLDFGLVVSSPVFESYCRHLDKEKLLARATHETGRAVVVGASANGGGVRNGSSRHSFSSPRCSIDW
ncbi:hypothetical protein OPV22_000093 [Ensete ventricosum]|uniref:Cyclin n=1 Tax=Ensete ventricosum TaxID=4639 RepID=A0AAV8RI55_ENSVE|nr:hypothetical protein OPV22_000093 [Ensete ventricosum]